MPAGCSLPGSTACDYTVFAVRAKKQSRFVAAGGRSTLMGLLIRLALLLSCAVGPGFGFNLSNTLGNGMVLQRAPSAAVVWGFASPGLSVTTTFHGKALLPPVQVGEDGIWRQVLPPTKANKTPTTIIFVASDGSVLSLKRVMFGDVFICSGQSNMQYTPRSMWGMNNLTAEVAAADFYGDGIRFFTVGFADQCGDPTKNQTNCTEPWKELSHKFAPVPAGGPCLGGTFACRESWAPASSKALGGVTWNTFSAVCWLFGRDLYNSLGGEVPIGLISSNVGGTPILNWSPAESVRDCNGPSGLPVGGGALYNSMIAPFTVGPMALTGVTWYQGEANVGHASDYACAFPSMINRWRQHFRMKELWFGFVQIAGVCYSWPNANDTGIDINQSLDAGDLRQAQLSALQLKKVGMSTAIDTGDWTDIHPPDKQTPARRLANQALTQIYGKRLQSDFPLYAGSQMSQSGNVVTVIVSIRAGGQPVSLTTDAPLAATQSTTRGASDSVPRNECVTSVFGAIKSNLTYAKAFPGDCGYPAIIGVDSTGANVSLNASAEIGQDGSSIVLIATAPEGFRPQSSSYGRASWPMTVFFSKDTQLPVIPWFANFSTTNPFTPPHWQVDRSEIQQRVRKRMLAQPLGIFTDPETDLVV
eukprot:SAG31_NODE_10_length_40133_cov_27.863041_15_plen_644_part_00